MNIEAMITRRRRRTGQSRLVVDVEPLSPVAHVAKPTDRTQLLEGLLDHLDPVFDGELPDDAYLYGPKGAGKSALVTVLFRKLGQLVGGRDTAMYTTTRVSPTRKLRFAYVNTRGAPSKFAFYRRLQENLSDEPVPRQGISTAALRDRLRQSLGGDSAALVLALDHVEEPRTPPPDTLLEWVETLPSTVSWLAIGRTEPPETPLADAAAAQLRVEPYRRYVLVNLLLQRATDGADRPGLDHDVVDRIAAWADGDAHDALAALFVACDRADRAGQTAVTPADIDAALDDVPRPCVALGRVFALRPTEQAVLRQLVDLDPDERASVTAATTAIAEAPSVDLAAGTIQRYLYELADCGLIDRLQSVTKAAHGRPPSRLEPRFPPTVFRRLYDAEN